MELLLVLEGAEVLVVLPIGVGGEGFEADGVVAEVAADATGDDDGF